MQMRKIEFIKLHNQYKIYNYWAGDVQLLTLVVIPLKISGHSEAC